MRIHRRERWRGLGSGSSDGAPERAWDRSGLRIGIAVVLAVSIAFASGVLVQREGLLRRARQWVSLRISPNYWSSHISAPTLPRLTIDLKFKHLETIRAKRDEALRRGLLFADDGDFVPAQLRFEGRTIDAKLRLKGDWTDHLETEKWSFRIKIKGDDQLFGMRRFSIQHPMTRRYVNEWALIENLRLEGVLAPRFLFVDVVFNGESKGIFALEEFFSKEMIESQGRREGLFLVSDENLRWRRRAQAMEIDRDLTSLFDLPGYHDRLFRTYGSGRIARNPKLSREREEAVALLRSFQEDRLAASKVFDVDLVARYLALAELWSVTHGLRSINSVFYFNPVTARLEPVAFDSEPMSVPRSSDPGDLFALQDDEWTSRALEDAQLMAAYLEQLRRVSTDEYLDSLREKIGAGIEENTLALHREWPSLTEPWSELARRQRILRAVLDPPRTVQALYRVGETSSSRVSGPARSPRLSVQVANITRLPIQVLGFRADGETIAASQALANPSEGAFVRSASSSVVLEPKTPGRPARYVDFSLATELALRDGESLAVLNRVVGEESVRETPMTRYPSIAEGSSLPAAPSVEEVLARHAFLESAPDGSGLRVRPGDWEVEGDLILPEGLGLAAGPGTALKFDREAVLLARGPLRFRGEPDRPLALGPKQRSWGGVVVLESGAASLWENVTIEKTRGIERGGWILTGGITFYASPIELSRVRISGSEAEDAINIIGTRFEFREVEIFDTQSDAFDGDFTRGAIFRSSFHDIAGDAIDVSGSLLEIQEVHASDVGDKGISVGEVSQVTVNRFEARRLGIGLASKDRSEVTIADSSIKGFRHAGLAAYSKKPEFGPAQIRATNVVLQEGPNPTLIQEGSWIDRDGTVLTGSALDVKELYAAGILGN